MEFLVVLLHQVPHFFPDKGNAMLDKDGYKLIEMEKYLWSIRKIVSLIYLMKKATLLTLNFEVSDQWNETFIEI